MQRQGVVAHVITYNALVSTCEKGKQPEQALELFKAMQRRDILAQLFFLARAPTEPRPLPLVFVALVYLL